MNSSPTTFSAVAHPQPHLKSVPFTPPPQTPPLPTLRNPFHQVKARTTVTLIRTVGMMETMEEKKTVKVKVKEKKKTVKVNNSQE